MYICICKGVTERAIREQVCAGARSVDEVSRGPDALPSVANACYAPSESSMTPVPDSLLSVVLTQHLFLPENTNTSHFHFINKISSLVPLPLLFGYTPACPFHASRYVL